MKIKNVQGWAKEWALGCVNPASWIPPDRYRLFHGLGASLPSMHGEESDLESECKRMISNIYRRVHSTGRMGWMAHQKWKEAKQLPGTAGPGKMLGCCLISFHFLWAIHPIRPVQFCSVKASHIGEQSL